jgi:hypothetical protein
MGDMTPGKTISIEEGDITVIIQKDLPRWPLSYDEMNLKQKISFLNLKFMGIKDLIRGRGFEESLIVEIVDFGQKLNDIYEEVSKK